MSWLYILAINKNVKIEYKNMFFHMEVIFAFGSVFSCAEAFQSDETLFVYFYFHFLCFRALIYISLHIQYQKHPLHGLSNTFTLSSFQLSVLIYFEFIFLNNGDMDLDY